MLLCYQASPPYSESCFAYSAREITEGKTKKDGIAIALSRQDQLACLTGYHDIYRAQASMVYGWVNGSDTLSLGCKTQKKCQKVFQKHISQTFPRIPKVINLASVMDHWLAQTSGMCQECIEVGEGKLRAGRAEFWENLPSLFNLPPWSELKEREDMYVLCIYNCVRTSLKRTFSGNDINT